MSVTEARRRHVRLSETQVSLLGGTVHFAYSALSGAAYGVVRSRVPIPNAAQGLATGALVYAANFPAWGLVPQRGILPPPTKQRPRKALIPVATHAVFGVTTAAAFKSLARGRLP